MKTSTEVNLERALARLDALCDTYLANRGTDSEFVVCITSEGPMAVWADAEALLEELK